MYWQSADYYNVAYCESDKVRASLSVVVVCVLVLTFEKVFSDEFLNRRRRLPHVILLFLNHLRERIETRQVSVEDLEGRLSCAP